MKTNPLDLPSEVDEPHIAKALSAFQDARAHQKQVSRDLTALERQGPAAVRADADAVAQARLEGKSEPKQKHQAEHRDKLEALKFEFQVSTQLMEKAGAALDAAIDEFGGVWHERLASDAEALDTEFFALVGRLQEIASARQSAHRVLGQQGAGKGARTHIPLHRSQLNEVTLMAGSNQTAWVAISDVLDGLAAAGQQITDPNRIVREMPRPAPLSLEEHDAATDEHLKYLGISRLQRTPEAQQAVLELKAAEAKAAAEQSAA